MTAEHSAVDTLLLVT